MFELLTSHVDTAIRAGELDLGESSQQMSFTMLMEKSWQQEIITAGVV
jgi:type III restriction enzyme